MKRVNFFILAMLFMVGSIFAQETIIDVTGNDFTHDEYSGTYGRQIVVADNGDVHVVYQKSYTEGDSANYEIMWKNLTTGATDSLPFQMDDLTRPKPGVAYIGGGTNAPVYFFYGNGGYTFKWGDMHHMAMAKVNDAGDAVEGLGTQDDKTYYHEPYYALPVTMEISAVTGVAHMINTSVGGDVLAYWNFDGTSFGEIYNMFAVYPDDGVPGKDVPAKYRRNATKGEDLAVSSDGSEVTLASLHPASNIWLHKGTLGGELWDDDFMTGLDNGTVVGLFDTTGTETGDNFANNDPKPSTDLQVVYDENDQLAVVYTATYQDQWLDTAQASPFGGWWPTYGSSGMGDTLATYYDGTEHPKPQLRFWSEASGTDTKIAESMYPLAGTTLKLWEDGVIDSGWACWGQGINDNLISHFNLITNTDAVEGEPKFVLAYQMCTSEPTMTNDGWENGGENRNRYYEYYSDLFVTVSMDGATWYPPVNITNTSDKDEVDLSMDRDVIDNKINMLFFRDGKAGRDDWLSGRDTLEYITASHNGNSGIPVRINQDDQVQIIHKVYDLSDYITDVDDVEILSDEYKLNQNYPNPFNPTTSIAYSIPAKADVTLKVYNNIGQLVTTLVNGVSDAGAHKVNWNAANVASGVYYYSIKAGEFTSTKKMILLK